MLHQRASQWYEQNGNWAEAIHHALAIPDWDRAVSLIGSISRKMLRRGEIATLLRWLTPLLDEKVCNLTGLWGLTFITAWFASTVNWAWERNFSWPEIRRGVYIYGTVFFLVLAFGGIRLRFFTPQTGTVRVHGFTVLEQDPELYFPKLMELWESDSG